MRNRQLSGPVLHLESALLRFFEQFGSVLRSQFNYFLDERCFLRCIDLGRRSGTRRNRCSHLFEERLLACRRADAKHPHRLRRGVMELVRSVRWNVDCFSSAHNGSVPDTVPESMMARTRRLQKCRTIQVVLIPNVTRMTQEQSLSRLIIMG